MATNKPKIAGYLPQALHEKFKSFALANEMSDSQAIAHILEFFFDGGSQGEPPSEPPQDRLAKIEDEIRLLKDMYSPIYNKLFPPKPDLASIEEVLGCIPADLVNNGELPGEPLSEPLDAQGEPQDKDIIWIRRKSGMQLSRQDAIALLRKFPNREEALLHIP